MKKVASISAFAVLVGAAALAQAAGVTLPNWAIGSGQYTDNFTATTGAFAGGEMTIGLRTVYRQSATRVFLDEATNTYMVNPGYQTAGMNGASTSAPNRAAWNFDWDVESPIPIAELDSLTLTITSPVGNTISLPFFDMLTLPDDHPGANVHQQSHNMTFGYTLNPFDANVPGTYTYTITAQEGSDVKTHSMNVVIIPLPQTAGLGMAGLGLIACRRQRRAV